MFIKDKGSEHMSPKEFSQLFSCRSDVIRKYFQGLKVDKDDKNSPS